MRVKPPCNSQGGFASLCYAIPLIQHHRNLINKLFRCRLSIPPKIAHLDRSN